MSSGGHKRRAFWRSLQWRLTFWYVGLLAVILLGLGVVLLVTVSQLLTASAIQRFQQEAVTAATARRTNYDSEVVRHDATGACITPNPAYANAFQTTISDPLTQAPAHMQSVTLLDYVTGEAIAPIAASGLPPPEFQADMLAKLDKKVGTKLANWRADVGHTFVFYRLTENGTPVEVALIAYEYRIPISCVATKTTYLQYPAVLMIVQNFAATEATIQSFMRDLGLSVAALFVLGFAIGAPVTGVQLRRLSRITAAARQIAAGNLRQRVGLRPQGDEIGELAQDFDEMAEQVEDSFARQQESEARVRQFIADASHELRTPLTSVRGYLDVLARHPTSRDPDVQHNLTAARNEAERMSKLVADLLTLARFDTGRPLELAQTDLTLLAGEAVDQARLLAGDRQVTLTGDGQGKLVAVVDHDRIKQVFLALLDNALKYGRQDAAAQVQMALRRTASHATISLHDNGLGIAEADLPHIFDRFYRAAHPLPTNLDQAGTSTSGSGLGLAIARAIIEAHSGAIIANSIVGQGTTFTITLPLQLSPPQQAGG